MKIMDYKTLSLIRKSHRRLIKFALLALCVFSFVSCDHDDDEEQESSMSLKKAHDEWLKNHPEYRYND